MSDLFFGPGARNTDPDTSHDAAARSPFGRAHDRWRALLIHAANPLGLTDFELGAKMERQQTSAGKRRGELRDRGYIRDSGMRRSSPSGTKAIVWTITQAGKNLASWTHT